MSILQPGRNCWRVEKAAQAAFLIDADSYFRTLSRALLKARRSIYIIGWDIDSRLEINREEKTLPSDLNNFLNDCVRREKDLHIHILSWDFAMIYALSREWLPLYKFEWEGHRRIRFRMDDQHPVGACHHQKIVVIDDSLAFVGGLDLTQHRWDTQQHSPDDPQRVDNSGRHYRPYHDVQMVVNGEAAAALGELARDRWHRATGEHPPRSPAGGGDLWPEGLAPDMHDVEVAIARTRPAFRGNGEVREIERLYLETLTTARHFIYIENQYFTANRIGKVLEKIVRQENGPEIVIVTPLETEGWLSQYTMDVLRSRMVRRLMEADRHDRLRVYFPDIRGLSHTSSINVHAKVTIIDDVLVRVGSANLNNRSMGLDTECDLVVDATGRPDLQRAIRHFHGRLLGEHLGTSSGKVEEGMARHQSLITAIEQLGDGRRNLKKLSVHLPEIIDNTIPDSAIVDPERPIDAEELTDYFIPPSRRKPAGRELLSGLAIVAGLLVLAALWRWTPLGDLIDVKELLGRVKGLQQVAYAPPLVIGGFVVGGLISFPVTVLIMGTVVVFGPLLGFIYSFLGSIISALAIYGIGSLLGRRFIRRLLGKKINSVSRQLARKGILTIIAVRIIPIAPFTVINLVAGASHIRLVDFTIGTILGMGPGILILTLLFDRVTEAAMDPNWGTFAVITLIIAVFAAAIFGFRQWLEKRSTTVRP